ncbi:EpsG family protein [Cetobacterium ceti]
MENYKKKIEKVMVYITFVINPTIIFFLKIYNIFKVKKIGKNDIRIIAIYMSLLGFLIAPLGDLYRHTEKFYYLQSLNFNDFLNFLKIQVDYLLYIVLYILAKCKISIQYLQLIIIFFSYYTTLIFYKKLSSKNIVDNKLIFFSLFFSIEIFTIAIGIRAGIAAHIYIYGIYKYMYENKKKAYLYFLMALTIHFYIILMIVIFFISNIIKIKTLKKLLWISLIFIFLKNINWEYILQNIDLGENLNKKLNIYLVGYWAKDFLKDFSFKYRISLFLKNIVYYPILLYFLFNKNKEESKLKKILLLTLICSNIFYPFIDVFGRYAYIAKLIGILMLTLEVPRKGILMTIYILSAITFFANAYSSKVNILNNYQYKILYEPIPKILFNNYYNKEWLNNKVNNDGGLKKEGDL